MGIFSINLAGDIACADGLEPADALIVKQLMSVWQNCKERNILREKYYLGHVQVKDLGIAMPSSLAKKIDPRIDWPKKAVHALADRSVLNGFTTDDDETTELLRHIYIANGLDSLYRKNLICELKHCCGFWTVSYGAAGEPVISAYPATAAAALWDDAQKCIAAGLVVAESKFSPIQRTHTPSVVNIFTQDAVIVLRRCENTWVAEYRYHSMGRPLIEPMAYSATLERPFGMSRITRSVMSITDDAIRQRARMEVAAESSALPQMWLLGTYKRVINDNNRYDASMGAINEITKDIDGDSPTIWQGAQLQMTPLNEYFRSLASQMSSVTNVPVSFFGVSSDNPSSADAIAASLEPLVIEAKNLNRDNGRALRNVAYMALAVARGTNFALERDRGANINPRFMSPAYPSTVSQSDAVLKQIQAIPKLADSDVMLELLDYTDEQMQRINSDAKKAQARKTFMSLLSEKDEPHGNLA
ncbi:phage portal protein [Collinsella sp. zg1085]|uniref:phage portal protein n=1 Tax=Collinsella sp. zg1085 TaxID=2844380 RepID=UPI001C0B647D|nr:phage portal protein [Collinsella sp. zg1085]QWT18106.1 phage portal protein [Collinsella sp. zg1085]